MIYVFKIRIFDKHERQFHADGEEQTEPIDNNWYRFDYFIDISKVRITSFREYVLFDPENTPIKCIKIFLTDGGYLYGSYSTEKFLEIYNTDYKKLYTEWVETMDAMQLKMLLEQDPTAEKVESKEEEEDDEDEDDD